MLTTSAKELGAALREARIARGETQRDLATRIGVTQSAVSKVEKGNAGASIGLIFQMLRALELPLQVGAADIARAPSRTVVVDDDVDLDAIANTGLRRK
jgi:HTH-type transcriptional regulator / antitoxin HipB